MKTELSNIIFEVTRQCNLNCKYCYNFWKRPGEGAVSKSSFRQTSKTLKRLLKLAKPRNFTFTGGEPLLSERITELVLMAAMSGARVTMITNGNAGDKTYYKALIEAGVSLFELPLHSHNSAIHDKLTRHPGSHSAVVDSVRAIQELDCELVTDIVLSKQNYLDIDNILSYHKELGIKRIMLTRFNPGGEGLKHINELLLSPEELRQCFDIANRVAGQLDIHVTSNVCTPLCVLLPLAYEHIATMSCSANMGNMPVTLDYMGNVRICNHSPVNIGNIYEQDFVELSRSEYVKSWKTVVPDYCKTCNVYDKCFGGCRAAAEQMGLGLEHPDPLIITSEQGKELKNG